MLDTIRQLVCTQNASDEQLLALLQHEQPQIDAALFSAADAVRRRVYGNAVYLRGLIEISSYCKNDCLYCGLRRSNRQAQRYRLTQDEILACAAAGYENGFRTFVLQGGEDAALTDDRLCTLVEALKRAHPDCAVTLSLGERSRESYRLLRQAGADRYLLRHETADPAHYALLHPPELSFENRLDCLHTLQTLGYQVGCGFLVGSPGQNTDMLVRELRFVQRMAPEMCGIGPFIPHAQTPFAGEPAGTLRMTLRLLALLRLLLPELLLPATTALGTISPRGRELGLQAGANVVMPNLSPESVRGKYTLYDNKLCTGAESLQGLQQLKHQLRECGYEAVVSRGDHKTKGSAPCTIPNP